MEVAELVGKEVMISTERHERQQVYSFRTHLIERVELKPAPRTVDNKSVIGNAFFVVYLKGLPNEYRLEQLRIRMDILDRGCLLPVEIDTKTGEVTLVVSDSLAKYFFASLLEVEASTDEDQKKELVQEFLAVSKLFHGGGWTNGNYYAEED
ncbi:hypothetical protein [Listeria phage LMTA-57]|uniref:Uncharacterized protein n=1 Tax=Listeria phage LMTA-57 TaxID=1486414 RepID=A0A068CC65_9CAUD|nr:hypothetical protein QLX42_gp055 [Listeria phage LMTA-57]AID17509.1 hypothetical protein [Listeria phage LMTA-57]